MANEYDANVLRERLKEYLVAESLNNKSFEEKCGLYNGFVRALDSKITFESLAKIGANCPNLNLGWLFSGVGQMYVIASPAESKVMQAHGVNMENVQAVFIANWSDIEPVMEKVMSKVMGGK